MTISFDENWDSGKLSLYSAKFTGRLSGTTDYVTAFVEACSLIPNTWYNGKHLLYLSDVGDVERVTEDTWTVPFEYGPPGEQQQKEEKFSKESDFNQQFEIGGGSAKITHSKATVEKYTIAGAGTGNNYHNAINVTDTAVEGVDIITPSFSFSETRNFYGEEMPTLRAILFALVGKVNSAPFFGFAPGEVLYVSATGGLKNGGEFGDVTHKFIASPNATGIEIGSIDNIAKRGHDYLWVRSQETLGANGIILEPLQVNVERVYDYADLNNIPYINGYGYL